jgi:biopolymer transport protein ExbD
MKNWCMGLSVASLAIRLLCLGSILSSCSGDSGETTGVPDDRFKITITDDGRICDSMGHKIAIADFVETIEPLVATNYELQLVIQADKHTKYAVIEDVLVAYVEAGGVKIIFNAEKCDKLREFRVELPVACGDPSGIPVEELIEIAADGTVVLDGMRFNANDVLLAELSNHLRGIRKMLESQDTLFYVNLLPSAETVYGRIIDVMEACADAGVEYLVFSESSLQNSEPDVNRGVSSQMESADAVLSLNGSKVAEPEVFRRTEFKAPPLMGRLKISQSKPRVPREMHKIRQPAFFQTMMPSALDSIPSEKTEESR